MRAQLFTLSVSMVILAVSASARANPTPRDQIVFVGLLPLEKPKGRGDLIGLKKAQGIRVVVERALEELSGQPVVGHGVLSSRLGKVYLPKWFECRSNTKCLARLLVRLRRGGYRLAMTGEYHTRKDGVAHVRVVSFNVNKGKVAKEIRFDLATTDMNDQARWQEELEPLIGSKTIKVEPATEEVATEVEPATEDPKEEAAVVEPSVPSIPTRRESCGPRSELRASIKVLQLIDDLQPVTECKKPETTDRATDEIIAVQRDGKPLYRREVSAARRTGAIAIDAKLDEAAWAAAPKVRFDWQQRPNEGARATGPTEFRVLYDDDAMYIGIHAIDPEPNKIQAVLHPPRMFRKAAQADALAVMLDPLLSRRMVYGFSVNAAGTRLEFRIFAGGEFDDTFSPMWNVETARVADGWIAEMRIPHSQTRVRTGYHRAWGFQVFRRIPRNAEGAYWSPFTFRSGQDVQGYGTLIINDTLDVGRPFELVPHVRGGAQLQYVQPDDRTRSTVEPEYGAGLDGSLQLFESTRLTATINPDFGQVEADPSEVNLTAQETFFTERRPFFTRDTEQYKFNIGRGFENLFYSRRVGSRPHLSQAGSAQFVNEDKVAPIYGALKISSDVAQGVQVSTLSAVTGEAHSTEQLADGTVQDVAIEPLSVYNVAQLTDTFRGGSSQLRATATATNRALAAANIDALHRQAYTGGVQYLHQFADNRWGVFGMVAGSYVEGPPAALEITQRSSRRYYQRPDASHIELDPDRTTLAGYAFQTSLRRLSGFWTGELGVEGRSPGFELNDLGYQVTADLLNPYAVVGYLDNTIEEGWLKEAGVSLAVDSVSNFAPELLRHSATLSNHLVFRNNTALDAGVTYTRAILATALLRGGPAVKDEDTIAGTLAYRTDETKRAQLSVSANALASPGTGSLSVGGTLSLRWDVLSNLELIVEPSVRRNINNTQYIAELVDTTGATRYLLGHLRQWEARATTRIEYTLTPRLSLSFYADPFVSAGRFPQLVDTVDPRGATYEDRFAAIPDAQLMRAMAMVDIDLDGDGLVDATIPEPDFSVSSLVTNLVFRWEYRPGSFFHLIWSQARQGYVPEGTLTASDASSVFTSRGVHVVLAKLSYYFGR